MFISLLMAMLETTACYILKRKQYINLQELFDALWLAMHIFAMLLYSLAGFHLVFGLFHQNLQISSVNAL